MSDILHLRVGLILKKKTAIAHFGSISKLADALNIKPQAISQWGDRVPEGRAYQIQHITNGALKIESKPMKQAS